MRQSRSASRAGSASADLMWPLDLFAERWADALEDELRARARSRLECQGTITPRTFVAALHMAANRTNATNTAHWLYRSLSKAEADLRVLHILTRAEFFLHWLICAFSRTLNDPGWNRSA